MLTYLRVYDRFDSWLIGWYFSPRFIFKEGLCVGIVTQGHWLLLLLRKRRGRHLRQLWYWLLLLLLLRKRRRIT